MTVVGTWTWAERTHGRLSRRNRVELLRQGLVAQLGQLALPWRRALVGDAIALSLPDPPDSQAARMAEERVRDLSSTTLYGHCMRTWAFAALIAQRDRLRHDPELLYLACVLHDLGLTEAHDGTDPAAACFAVEGARGGLELLTSPEAGDVEVDRARHVAEAISLHLNVTVPASLGAEAHLLSKAAALDTIGRFLRYLPAPTVDNVDRGWPRDGFAQYLSETIGRQARLRPDSRAAFLVGLGFTRWVLTHPLDRANRSAE